MAILGSYSREENTADSDLDILVEFNDKIGIRFVDLADEIEKIVGLKVDLVSRNGIKEGYLHAIDFDLIYVWARFIIAFNWYVRISAKNQAL